MPCHTMITTLGIPSTHHRLALTMSPTSPPASPTASAAPALRLQTIKHFLSSNSPDNLERLLRTSPVHKQLFRIHGKPLLADRLKYGPCPILARLERRRSTYGAEALLVEEGSFRAWTEWDERWLVWGGWEESENEGRKSGGGEEEGEEKQEEADWEEREVVYTVFSDDEDADTVLL